jgi:long-chain acyl-CoA synthetase
MWTQIQAWTEINQVFNAYGITETGSWVAGTTGGEVIPESGLIGAAWGSVIKVLSVFDTQNILTPDMECASGETGMIWLNTPALMKGYFQRDDLTNAVVSHGWFMTGDIGILDVQGRLFIRGRERDEINKGGMKVFPADIDGIVEQLSVVNDVCSFGFTDEAYGENVAIALVLENQEPGTVLEIQEWIATHLAEHKHPVRWYLIDEIPRTSRGKINRSNVMESCMAIEPLNLNAVLKDARTS